MELYFTNSLQHEVPGKIERLRMPYPYWPEIAAKVRPCHTRVASSMNP